MFPSCRRSSPARVARSSGLAMGLSALLASSAALALDPAKAPTQYARDVYTEREGLPQNSARAVLPSRRGDVWVGTDEGLARFDGSRFTVYDRRTAPGMTSNLVFSLAEATDATIWIGTLDGGLLRLRDGRIEPAPLPGPLPDSQIRGLFDDGAGTLWIATSGGLARWHGSELRAFTRADGLPGRQVNSVSRGADGRIWVGTDGGAAAVDGDRILPGPAELAGVRVNAIVQAPNGDLWAATSTRGLASVQGGHVRFFGSKEGSFGDEVRAVIVDRDGNVWAGYEAGVVRLRGSKAELLRRLPGNGSERIWSLVEDTHGSLWVGAEIGGLARYRDAAFVPFGAKEGLGADFTAVIAQGSGDSVFVGTAAGLSVLTGGASGSAREAFGGHGTVLSLCADHGDGLWVGTLRGEVGLLRGGDMRWLSARATPPVGALMEDRDGVLWIGTGVGLARLHGDAIEPVPESEGLPPGRVHIIAQDAKGSLWVSIETRGVFRRPTGGRFALVPDGPPAAHDANDALVDPDDTVWIGTLGAGLWRWRDGRFTSFGLKEGLPDDVVWRTLDDGLGNLWFSSNKGVHRVSRRELEDVASGRAATVTAASYGVSEGMRTRECNGGIQPAGVRTRDGLLWFPTNEGVAVVNPARLTVMPPPPVVIDRAVVDGSETLEPRQLDLPAGTTRFEIGYTALALTAPGEVRFRYRLEGYDESWVDVGATQAALFMHVPPGHYRFGIQARVGHSAWSEPVTLAVALRPHFWQTLWFYLIALAAAIGAAASVHLLRVRYLRQQERLLRARVDEALAQVKVLSGLLPICAWCKKIRDDGGHWQKIEQYIADRSQAAFTHAMCPQCFKEFEESDRPSKP